MLRYYFDQHQYNRLLFWLAAQGLINDRVCNEAKDFFRRTYQLNFRWTSSSETKENPELGYLSAVLEFKSEQDYLIFCLQDMHNLVRLIKQARKCVIEEIAQ